ncbi:MAG: polyprenyl synthetase family protein [Candidatus Hydrothermales bacterium]
MDIKELYKPVKDGIELVNFKIKEIFKESYLPKFQDSLLQGKRLRPLLVLYSSFAFRDLNEEKVHVACAVELVHFASLIHDDVVDEAKERRRAFTLNYHYGNHVAVLLGDFVFSKAMEFISKVRNPDLYEILSRTSVEMCEGEIIDEFLEREKRFDLENYLTLIKKKTASLFSASCEMGALLSGCVDIERMKSFGSKFGLLFQILDDLHDFYREGEDIKRSKVTLPHILFKDLIREKFPKFFVEENENLSRKVRIFLIENGVTEKCYGFLDTYFKELKDITKGFDKTIRDYLYSFIDYLNKNKIFLFDEKIKGSNPKIS